MNILDSKNIDSFNGDKLKAIFEAQKELMKKYKEPIGIEIDTREGQNKIRQEMWRVTEELGEAANCLRMKDWVHTEILTDRNHFKEELSDAIHFFIELFLICGIDSDEFFKLYFLKNQVNQFRINTNY